METTDRPGTRRAVEWIEDFGVALVILGIFPGWLLYGAVTTWVSLAGLVAWLFAARYDLVHRGRTF